MPLLTIQALWIGVITGLLSRTYAHLLGILAMTNCWRKFSQQYYIIHPFLQQSLNVPQDLPKIFIVLQGGFVISDIVFGCDDPTYNPSPVRELSLLTQFSGFTTLQSLVSEKQCKWAWSTMILSMRSNDLTYNLSPSNS